MDYAGIHLDKRDPVAAGRDLAFRIASLTNGGTRARAAARGVPSPNLASQWRRPPAQRILERADVGLSRPVAGGP